MKFYRDADNGLYVDPILANHNGLVEITEEEFNVEANPPKTAEQLEAELIAKFKALYLDVVDAKLKELDYDSLTTVKLWEGDATYGAEASKIIGWYKSIITYNYTILSSGAMPTEDEYLGSMPIYV